MNKKKNVYLAMDSNKKVYCFNNISKFSKERDLDPSHVCKCLNHPNKNFTHNGYIFKKVDKRIKKESTAMKYSNKIFEK
jgi:hypothetical protein